MAIEISESIADTIVLALTGAIPAVGTAVERDREDAIARDECPRIVVTVVSDVPDVATIAGDVHECSLVVAVSIHVVGGATPWQAAASAIAVAAHPLIRGATYPAGVSDLVGPTGNYFAQSADGSPGVRTMTYQFTYFRSAAALDVAA